MSSSSFTACTELFLTNCKEVVIFWVGDTVDLFFCRAVASVAQTNLEPLCCWNKADSKGHNGIPTRALGEVKQSKRSFNAYGIIADRESQMPPREGQGFSLASSIQVIKEAGSFLKVLSGAYILLKKPLPLCLIVWQLKQTILTRFNMHWKRDWEMVNIVWDSLPFFIAIALVKQGHSPEPWSRKISFEVDGVVQCVK